MRKVATVVFLTVIAVSSGLMQFGFHLCNEDGLHLFEHNCKSKGIAIASLKNPINKPNSLKNCCSNLKKFRTTSCEKGRITSISEKCCTEDFVYFVNPLPEKFATLQFNSPIFFETLLKNSSEEFNIQDIYSTNNYFESDFIPIHGYSSPDYRRFLRSWSI